MIALVEPPSSSAGMKPSFSLQAAAIAREDLRAASFASAARGASPQRSRRCARMTYDAHPLPAR
ncbi:hypothetical protein BE08_10535 [Sorangium cellulosum]|uniref:Uncharacterized protein n=1 Tax=Sorangium cellulosum TaxID=56 RepID=A0A150PSC6_SORCE|nr:hypothetical protein BE08_10535 [Sorangium cellulosum]